MAEHSPLDGSLLEAAALLRKRAVSSCDLTAASIARAKETHAQLNAFLRIEEETAMRAAAKADRELAAGKDRGPLHGIPLAHKDMFYRAGEITSCGSEIRRDFRGAFTSKLIERLENAGAVTVGWLNLSEFAGGPTGHNKHYGDCRNPWDTTRISGGSSSGSGAAVASRIVFGALGSDTGGSVRIPAACCGVVGVKATYGLVSRHGAMPRSWSLDHVGPLARSVEDAAVLTQAIAGVNDKDATAWVDDVPDYAACFEEGMPKCRIGRPVAHYLDDAEPSAVSLFEDALQTMTELGHEVVDVDLPDPMHLSQLNDVISKSEAAAVHRKWLIECPEKYGNHVRTRIEAGLAIPAYRYLEALSARTTLTREYVSKVFGRCDVVCMPTLPFAAPDREASNPDKPAAVLDLVRKMTYRTRSFNYLGIPAFSVPMGFDSDGMPLGLQLVGAAQMEWRLFQLGHHYQRMTEWHMALPPIV